jgi:hypothetical protein
MFATTRRVRARIAALMRHRDRGAETVEVMLWIAAVIVIVGGVGALFRNDLVAFFNSLVYDIGFTR